MTIPDLDRCGAPDHHPDSDAEDVVVIVCDHVLNRDDYDEAGITVKSPGPSRSDGPVRHECGRDDCGETALCSDCWNDL